MMRSCSNNNGEKNLDMIYDSVRFIIIIIIWFFPDEAKRLKQDLQGPSENNDWKAQCLTLQDQIGKKIAFKR